MTEEERNQARTGDDQRSLLASVALIDDFTVGSSCPKEWAETASDEEKNRLNFRIHTTALHQLFITMMQASEHDKETNKL